MSEAMSQRHSNASQKESAVLRAHFSDRNRVANASMASMVSTGGRLGSYENIESLEDWEPDERVDIELDRNQRHSNRNSIVDRMSQNTYYQLRESRKSHSKFSLGGAKAKSEDLTEELTYHSTDDQLALDSDLNDLFAGLFEGTVPTMSHEFSACDPRCILGVHIGGVVVLAARFLVIWLYRHAATSELIKSVGMAAAYLVLGVMMPHHAESLVFSDPVRRILTIREAYHFHANEHKGIRRFAKYFRVIQPFTVGLSCVPPIISLVQVLITDTDEEGSYTNDALSIYIFASGTLWFVLMASFGAAAVELVCVDSSEICIKGVASDLLRSGRDIDWASMHRKCVRLHEVLCAIWAPQNVGGLWLSRMLILLAASLAIGATSLHHPHFAMRVTCRSLAGMMAIAGCYLLLHIALITLRCRDLRPFSKSITDLTLRCGGRVPQEHVLDYQNFVNYLYHSSFGIQIHGVAINLRLFGLIFVNMVGTLQIALIYVGHILYPDRQT